MKKNTFVILSVVAGLLLVAVAIMYWVVPAGSLATFVPGYEVGSNHIHVKHGLGSLILGLGLFAYAWFKSGEASSV
jgi:hypothetical protein